MSATYTSAASRDARRISASARRFDAHDVLLAATSCVCLLAIGLAFAGRVRTTSAEVSRTSCRLLQGEPLTGRPTRHACTPWSPVRVHRINRRA